MDEFHRASARYSPFHSAHEGYAVLKEEMDELWDEIKKDQSPFEMKQEAIQVAAMAVRFIYDICEKHLR
jgi:hypothetical protein